MEPDIKELKKIAKNVTELHKKLAKAIAEFYEERDVEMIRSQEILPALCMLLCHAARLANVDRLLLVENVIKTCLMLDAEDEDES